MERGLLFIATIFTVIEWLSLCYAVLNKPIHKPKKIGLMVSVVITIILIWTSNYHLYNVLTLLLIYTFFSQTVFGTLKTWVLSYAIIIVLESCVSGVLSAFSIYVYDVRPIMIIECASFVIILIWIYYWLIGKKLSKDFFDLPKPIWRLFIIAILLTMLMMSYFNFVLEDVPNIKMVQFGSVIILTGGLAICGMILGIIYYFNNTEKYKMENEIAEKYNEQQREYFMRLLEKEQDTRSFRHDIINHLMAMQGFAEKEELEILKQYVADLLGDINGEKYRQYDIGNEVVNTILNYYLLPIKENCNITIEGYMSEHMKVSQKDLCTLFSNMVKNAVEAIEDVDHEKKITIIVNQGKEFLNISISNTVQNEIVWYEDGLLQTTKQDKKNHGLGLKNVKQVVLKYAGRYVSKIENECFITEIYLKI